MTRAIPLLLSGLALLGVGSPPAQAEHEVYYRYVVLGFVTDARGTPVPSVPVEVTRDRTGFSYLGESDAAGFYLVIARLGDESRGETLTLRLGTVTTSVVAAFDPGDHRSHRGTRVDLVGGRPVERAPAFQPTLAQYLGGGAR